MTVNHHRARAAYAVVATGMRTGQAKLLAQEVVQQKARLDAAAVAPAVDRYLDLVARAHCTCPPARRHAVASARLVNAATR